jgi:hypothetical protein
MAEKFSAEKTTGPGESVISYMTDGSQLTVNHDLTPPREYHTRLVVCRPLLAIGLREFVYLICIVTGILFL